MLFDKIIRIGYILQMVKEIPPNSNRCLSMQCERQLHYILASCNDVSVGREGSPEGIPSPCVHVLSDEYCSSRVTNCPYWQHHLELQAMVT